MPFCGPIRVCNKKRETVKNPASVFIPRGHFNRVSDWAARVVAVIVAEASGAKVELAGGPGALTTVLGGVDP